MRRSLPSTSSLHSRSCRPDGPALGRLAAAVDDATLGQVVGSHLYGHRVPGEDADVVLAHFARDVCGHDVTVLELHAECGVGQSLGDLTLHLNGIFFRHWGADIAQTPTALQCA